MNMTQEEVTKRMKALKARCERLIVSSDRGPEEWRKDAEALDLALTALRPVSREQVEKVFGGKWEEETYTTVSGRGRVIHSKKYTCSACGKANGRAKTNFCHHCGAPMTDKAVEMVMERLEALYASDT